METIIVSVCFCLRSWHSNQGLAPVQCDDGCMDFCAGTFIGPGSCEGSLQVFVSVQWRESNKLRNEPKHLEADSRSRRAMV